MNSTLILILVLVAIGLFFWYVYKKQIQPSKENISFTVDLTQLAREKKLKPFVGMEETVERLIHIIARKDKNNPLLIGEPGVGKTAVVEGLAQRITDGNVPEAFKGKTILSLNLASLMGGTHLRGELEKRVQDLLSSLESESRKTILFIDELHMIEQARGGEGALDIADVLKPALSRGDLQVIGATTWQEYQKYLKPDAAIERRFQPVLVEEPTPETAIEILKGVKESYEKFHGVCISAEAIETAVKTSVAFIKDRFLPDKAFDVIDEACAKVAIESSRPHAAALGLIHAASEKVKSGCGEGVPTVTAQDVEEVASQWHEHKTKPQA